MIRAHPSVDKAARHIHARCRSKNGPTRIGEHGRTLAGPVRD
jgi:hypothetical protein